MVRPLIGLSFDHDNKPERRGRIESEGLYHLHERYAQALEAAGALPVALPYLSRAAVGALADRLDGVLLTGGAFDIDPLRYGESPVTRLDGIKPDRTRFEIALLKAALKRDRPVLAVCGGEQLLNIALGGSLWQDITAQLAGAAEHEQKIPKDRPYHDVALVPGSVLARAVRRRAMRVNSTHHQAVKRLGRGLTAAAHAPDGLIEAIEMPRRRFVVGVQWHPELLADRDMANARLIAAFVRACRS